MENLNTQKVVFKQKTRSSLEQDISRKVEQYFKQEGISKKGNTIFFLKGGISLLLLGLSYAAIYLVPPTAGNLILCYIALGFFSTVAVFNLGHDAMHGSASMNPKINRLLGYSWNMVGISSYVWKLIHNYGHHALTNVPGKDLNVGQTPIIRLNPTMKRGFMHQFQHIYSPFLLSLLTIDLVLIKDFKMLTMTHFGNKRMKHSRSQRLRIYVLKIFYLLYALALPMIFVQASWGIILLAFLCKHIVAGLFVAVVLLPTHMHPHTYFPEPDEDGVIACSWFEHQLEVTIDFSVNTPIVGWLTGGINYHVAHHLFPHICHIHYPALTHIIRETAAAHGKRYTNTSWAQMLADGMTFLKDLGTLDDLSKYSRTN